MLLVHLIFNFDEKNVLNNAGILPGTNYRGLYLAGSLQITKTCTLNSWIVMFQFSVFHLIFSSVATVTKPPRNTHTNMCVVDKAPRNSLSLSRCRLICFRAFRIEQQVKSYIKFQHETIFSTNPFRKWTKI